MKYHHIKYKDYYIYFYLEKQTVKIYIANKINDEPYEDYYEFINDDNVYKEVLTYLKNYHESVDKIYTKGNTHSLINFNASENFESHKNALLLRISDIQSKLERTSESEKQKVETLLQNTIEELNTLNTNKAKFEMDFKNKAHDLLNSKGGNTVWKMSDTKERQILPGNKRSSVIYVRILLNGKFGQTKYVKCKNGYKTLKSALSKTT